MSCVLAGTMSTSLSLRSSTETALSYGESAVGTSNAYAWIESVHAGTTSTKPLSLDNTDIVLHRRSESAWTSQCPCEMSVCLLDQQTLQPRSLEATLIPMLRRAAVKMQWTGNACVRMSCCMLKQRRYSH
jgi:hypothetical protein